MASNSKLNPQIANVEIGVRNLRKIKIYPLSVGDQLSLSDLVVEALNTYNEIAGDKKKSDIEVFSEIVNFAINLIKENLDQILDKITDQEEDIKLLDEITNDQAFEIGKVIYEVNFANLIKNVTSLFGGQPEGMTEQLLKRQSPRSVSTTAATGSNTSTKKRTKKEGSR